MSHGATRPGPAWPVLPDDGAPRPRAQPGRRVAGPLLALAAGVAALGVPLGLLWAQLAPAVPIRVTDDGAAFAEAQPEQLVAADGWFTLLAVPFGLLVALGMWTVSRTRGAVGLVAGSAAALAAGVIAWLVGRQVGLAGYEAALASASPGTVLDRPPDLRVVETGWWPPLVAGAPLVPALVAAVTYTLLAAWSRFPELRPDRFQPVDAPGQ